jgi:ribosomal protein S18 acetylase RimI-like enzyme
MPSHSVHLPRSTVGTRLAGPSDLDALVALENLAFATDHLSRRSFRNFLHAPKAALIVAESGGALLGYALVLFRSRSPRARLYSIAVAPHGAGRGLGRTLLLAAEAAAMARGRSSIRLEVHERNAGAIALYRKAGYLVFGRHHEYYGDKGNALRFEKALTPPLGGSSRPPH